MHYIENRERILTRQKIKCNVCPIKYKINIVSFKLIIHVEENLFIYLPKPYAWRIPVEVMHSYA